MKYWEKRYETKPVEELRQIQLERLQATINRIFRHGVTFYRKRFDESGFDPENVESLEALEKLPVTTRQDLKESYPYEMFAVPLREVVRVHEASGDSGIVGYTKSDLDNWSGLVARALCASGIGEDDPPICGRPPFLFRGRRLQRDRDGEGAPLLRP
jgi:phenylacetate-CoA ligase